MKRYLVQPTSPYAIAWESATVLEDFTLPWDAREPAATSFRALWEPQRLHFRFDCVDDGLVLPDAPTLSDRVLGSDRVEIFFAPDLALQPYFCLEMSPRGEALEYEARFYREMNWDWRCAGLELAAQIENGRYTVTGSVPLDTLRQLGVLRGREMFTGLYRADFRHLPDGSVQRGWMPWVDPRTEKPDFHVPASFGVMELVQA